MLSSDRTTLRQFYSQTWSKAQQGQTLNALETQIAQVISEHPEYHAWLSERHLDTDFAPEWGQTNPFLHMGLHLGLREQLATDRPAGIHALYQQLLVHYAPHALEHQMMECLAESLWQAQRNQQSPDEAAYLACLEQLRKL
ncbi:DUF1841 family protein [Thiofilum flexile]|uniref:DUF1841 family protein n=1 Tax=Thiofilum flexile TaxID=125627 RepID=UPI000367F5AB|nr:DUF1841 family protein [Thiofilum flexile]